MPTRNINLTERWDSFVDEHIRSGRFANASEVVRAGLYALEQDDAEDKLKLEALDAALKAGEESGIYEGDIEAEMEEYITQLALQAGKR